MKITELALKNNYFEFNGQVKQKISGPTITKFAPAYASIFMGDVESKFLQTQLL